MSTPKPPQPVKLIASIIAGKDELFQKALARLTPAYGETDYISQKLPFDFTDYYEDEIGTGLFRHFVTFATLVSPEVLPAAKLFANEIEASLAGQDEKRRVNVDPGYISLWHLILATCKRFAHRPYLRDGVYADLTLIYQGKTFKPLFWTFPDYGSEGIIQLLNDVRERYHRQLKAEEE